MKKLLSLVLTLMLALSMLAAPTLAEEEPLQVYGISVMSGGAAWGRFEDGFMDACEELGYEGHYLAPANPNDYTSMVQLCETALNNGADALLVAVTEPTLFQDVLTRAIEQNVVVIGVAAGLEGYTECLVGTDPVSLGENTAIALVDLAAGEQINVAVGQTRLADANQNVQVDAFIAKLSELDPNAVIVDRFECNSSASVSADRLSALYVANPELNACVSFDSYVGVGAASFVGDYGIQDSFIALGIDDGAEVLTAVKSGNLDATIAQQWYKIGQESVYCVERSLAGEELEYNQGIETVIIYPEDVDAHAEENGIVLE